MRQLRGDGVCTGECGYAAAAATTPVRRAQVLRLGSRHRTLMRYRRSNLAEHKAPMRVFCGTQTPSCKLLVRFRPLARARQRTPIVQRVSLPARPSLPGGRSRAGEMPGGCCRHQLLCANCCLQKSQPRAVQNANPARKCEKASAAARRGQPCRSPTISNELAPCHTPNATSSRRGTRRRTSSTRSLVDPRLRQVETKTTRMTARCARPAARRRSARWVNKSTTR